ncbi:PP2C family protein-serine/threonine phosphatase [Streptomyces sp. NPDC055709]
MPILTTAAVGFAALRSWKETSIYGAIATITAILLYMFHGPGLTLAANVDIISCVIMMMLVAFMRIVMLRQCKSLQNARNFAERLVGSVQPPPPSRIGPLEIAARYVAATSDTPLGGDFYSITNTPFGVRFIIGDVQGKGIGAAAQVVNLLGSFRAAAENRDILEVVSQTERVFKRNKTSSESNGLESFATAIIGEVDIHEWRIRIVHRGHISPMLILGGGVEVMDAQEPGLPIGLGEFHLAEPEVYVAQFPPGSTFVALTDGITEARDPSGVFYDPVKNLPEITSSSPGDLLDYLLADVSRNHNVTDDIAIIAMHRPTGCEVEKLELRTVYAPTGVDS